MKSQFESGKIVIEKDGKRILDLKDAPEGWENQLPKGWEELTHRPNQVEVKVYPAVKISFTEKGVVMDSIPAPIPLPEPEAKADPKKEDTKK